METILIIVGCILILSMIVLIMIIRQNSVRQEMIMKQISLENQSKNYEDFDRIRDSLTLEMAGVKEKFTQDLILFQNQVLQSMKGDLHLLNETTANRLVNIENKVNESMLKGLENSNKAFNSVLEQMARIDEAQKNLSNLSTDILSLQSILSDKKTRGTFGEVELYSLLESVYGVNDQRYQRQVTLSNGSIADCVLYAPEPLGQIVVDSKFPLENYNRMVDSNLSKEDQNRARNAFRFDVLKHIKDISSKYLIKGETADIAYMFIPAEAVFAEIYGHFDDLIQMSYQYKVYLVSPTTLMAYITAIKAIYLGQERNEKIELIQDEFNKLAKEFDRFVLRWQTIEKDFKKVDSDFKDISVTSDKIQRRFKQIESVNLDQIDNSDSSNILE